MPVSSSPSLDEIAQLFHVRFGQRARFVRGSWYVDQQLSSPPTDLASEICQELGRTDLLNFRCLSEIVRRAARIQQARPWTLAEALQAAPPKRVFARFPPGPIREQALLLRRIGALLKAKKRATE